ncbi:restriction endonuclease subunit S [Naumannella halotolerans]|uniref:restriction endonuclease subunit S n=1 Tax=Naumannella halotolerans TaxID=993414 RepID=UPI00370D2E2E
MREIALGEALDALIDHRGKTPKKLGGDFTLAGVKVVSAIHIKNGRINWEERERYVSVAMFQRWMPEPTRRGDVLLTSEAPLGEVAQVEDDEPLVLSQRLFALRGKQGLLDSTYLRYFLQSDFGRHRLLSMATGSTVSGIRQELLRQVKVPLPSLEEQERIAGVLGAFDDLIETNRRLSGDLLARLFAEYEVLGRRQPSTTFGTVARLVRDQWKPGSEGPHRYLGLEHFATEGGGLIGHGSSSGVQSVSLRFARGDVLYGKLRPYFRKVARPGFDGLCSSEVWVLRAQEGYPQSLVHALAHSPRFSEVAMAGSGGTRMPRADWKQVSALPVPDLGSATMSQAELNGLEALWFAACELDDESKDLARQRDELLPLLMSGKVRVRDVEVATS